MFDTPEEVMSYLCYQYKVHEVPLGSQQTKDMIHTVRFSDHRRYNTRTDQCVWNNFI